MNNVKERKKYKEIFEQRFKSNIILSEKKYEEDFCIEFMNEITISYKDIDNQHKNNGINNYIELEKSRLEVEIKRLESIDASNGNIEKIAIIIGPIVTFFLGTIFVSSNNFVQFRVNNMLPKAINDNKIEGEIMNILKDFLSSMTTLLAVSIIVLIAIISLVFIISNAFNKQDICKRNRILTFNRLCYESIKRL